MRGISNASRACFLVEGAVVFLVAAVLWIFLFWSLVSIGSNLLSVVVPIAYAVVAMGCIAMVNILRQLFGAHEPTEIESLMRDGVLAMGAGITAVASLVLGRMLMSPNDRWVYGLDFLELGCVIWIPIGHVVYLLSWDRLVTNVRAGTPNRLR